MKTLLRFVFLFLVFDQARASTAVQLNSTTQPITVNGNTYNLGLQVSWACDDYPYSSSPGKIELLNGAGTTVARVVASVYRGSPSITVSGSGSVTGVNFSIIQYCPDGTPADGDLTATWHITGLSSGNYTLRFWQYQTYDSGRSATTVWTSAGSTGGSSPQPPTIAWTSTPGTVGSGQSYTISAHGHDNDGNLTAVSIWKSGQPFAFAGGGNGSDGDSGNSTSDTGPASITFTAQAFDGDGNASAIISQTVTITASNQPPTIAWTSTPGTVGSGQSYTISAHGHDANGNLTTVNIWKNSQPFAFAGGGNGFDGDSQNATSDTGPTTVTFTAQASDGSGASSPVITQTVTVTATNRAPTISWNSTPGTVANGQSYSISAHGHDPDGNLTQVNVWKNGQPYAFGGGGNGFDADSGNASTDTGPQSITYTAQAVDSNGAASATISQTVTVSAPPPVNHPPTISWNTTPGTVASGQSYTVSAHGHDQDGNLTQVNVWRNGQPYAFGSGGNGSDADSGNASTDTGPQSITYTAQAVDSNGAASGVISQTVTVSAPPPVNHAPTISWNTAPGTVASSQSYTVSAHGHDQDGNLTQVNVWRNGQPYAFGGGGNGADADSGNASTDTGPQSITYTAQAVDSNGATSGVISQTVTVSAPPPVNHAPTISWNTTPGGVASGQGYTVSAHGNDQDSNLSQIRIWKNGQPFTTTAVSGSDGDSSSTTTDTGPQTITFTAQAFDALGATSTTISQVVTISAPPPTQYTLTTSASVGGGVSVGGTYNAGTILTVSASPDAMHDFAGWSGDASGSANPVSVTLDRNKSVQANFSPKMFALTTSTNGGGSVTPSGSYPARTWVTISANPDATHQFSGWTGDASGTAPTVAVYLDRAKSAQALFASKASQTISFTPPGDHTTNSPPFALDATASSGLPVTFTLLSGPATIITNTAQVTGPGAVSIQASQSGDGTYLAATPVIQTFNAVASVSVKYRAASRTLLESEQTRGTAPFVVEKP